MRKFYCDLCGKEIVIGLEVDERENKMALNIVGVHMSEQSRYDVCKDCLDVVKSINWSETLQREIQQRKAINNATRSMK